MSFLIPIRDFDNWRAAARRLLASETPPEHVLFTDGTEPTLFTAELPPAGTAVHRVPKQFLDLAEAVACHRDPGRWHRLYRAVWRLMHGEPHLLALATDADVYWLLQAERAVRRDSHKMKAFVRFRAVGEQFVAWHKPDHFIVRRVAPFFARRFPQMHWTILTPDESVSWDGSDLRYGPGVPRTHAPRPDELEPLWAAYYRSTFNPARIKLKAMKKELPVRHWPTLPETAAIADMLADAPRRVAEMVGYTEGFTEVTIPPNPTLASLREAVAGCSACGLCGPPPVVGVGPADARVVLVGEQPTDDERAGEVLNEALRAAGLKRSEVYLTHAVKHRPTTDDGRPRRASVRERLACRPWLLAELSCLTPAVVVCLGPAAAAAVLGPLFRYADRRGEVVLAASGTKVIATRPPSANTLAEVTRHLAVARAAVEGEPAA